MTEIATWGGERRVMAWLFRLGDNSDACGRHSHAPATFVRCLEIPFGRRRTDCVHASEQL